MPTPRPPHPSPSGRFLALRLRSEPTLRLAAVAAGGALGTLARYGVNQALPAPASGIPWPTLTVNLTGSFILGVVLTLVTERWPPTRFVRPFVAVGVCGGFTTFSTLMVESVRRTQTGHAGVAVGYLALSLVAGTVAAAAGVVVARGRRPGPAEIPDPDSLGTLGHATGTGPGTGGGRTVEAHRTGGEPPPSAEGTAP